MSVKSVTATTPGNETVVYQNPAPEGPGGGTPSVADRPIAAATNDGPKQITATVSGVKFVSPA